jgi:hypothetical protein
MAYMSFSLDGDMIDLRDIAEFVEEQLEFLANNEEAWEEDPEIQAVIELADDLCYNEATNGDIHAAVKMLTEMGESYGVFLIAEDYFVDYAQDMADSIGAIDSNAGWPLNFIDWDAAAEALKSDYQSVHIKGTEYFYANY